MSDWEVPAEFMSGVGSLSIRRDFVEAAQEDPDSASKSVFLYGLCLNKGVDSALLLAETEEDEQVPLWLVSFTDIMALMLTFFVLLYSMSVPDELKWNELIQSAQQGITKYNTRERFAGENYGVSIDKIETKRGLDLAYLQTIVSSQMQDSLDDGSLLLVRGDGMLILSMPQDLSFDSGQESLSLDGKRVLVKIVDVLRRVPNRLEIVGHADPRPLTSSSYVNNWELSLKRALNVASALSQAGYARDLTVRGVSSARYDDISDQLPQELREKFSRRVDIVLMPDTGRRKYFAPSLVR